MITLRPHHALCLQTYSGKGYSGDFTNNLDKIFFTLCNNPETLVTFDFSADEVCRACPKLVNGVCENEDSCGKLDIKVADAVSIQIGTVYTWSEICQKVKAYLLDNQKYIPICSGCRWESLCNSMRK